MLRAGPAAATLPVMADSNSSFVHVSPQTWGVVTRVLCHKVTEREASIVEHEVSDAAGRNQWRVAVDMSEITFLASAGLGAMVTISRKAKEGGGKLVLFAVNDDLLELFKISRLDRLIAIKPDLDAAVKALS